MNKKSIRPKRALISVSNKQGLVEFASHLIEYGVELISTGGTANFLKKHDLAVTHVSEITDFPEIMGGRVKTLHPLLLGGLLGRRDIDQNEADSFNIGWIDLLICNLYPFEQAIENSPDILRIAIENIDVGGPTMIRAAAKNFEWTTAVVDVNDYSQVIDYIAQGGIPYEARKHLTKKAFNYTAKYDTVIARYFDSEDGAKDINLNYKNTVELRYGENPHQSAWVYGDNSDVLSVLSASQLQGKKLSYNNLVDTQAAIDVVYSLKEPTAVIIKHAMPCGVAYGASIATAFDAALNSDRKSAFGGIIGFNRPVDEKTALELESLFVEVVIAPAFDPKALTVLKQKKSLRLLVLSQDAPHPTHSYKYLPGGLLVQTNDSQCLTAADLTQVSGCSVSEALLDDMIFSWHCVKHLKSNAIAIVASQKTVGLSGGQVSRVDAVKIALNKAGKKANSAVLASDAFFPFRDSIDLIASSGVNAIIQPGGSKRDDEVINACKQHNITMFFTGIRCFNH